MNILNQMNKAIKNLPQTLETTFIGEILTSATNTDL